MNVLFVLGSAGAKRDATQAGASALNKAKSKVMRPSPPTSAMGQPGASSSAAGMLNMPTLIDKSNVWESLAIECEPTEFIR